MPKFEMAPPIVAVEWFNAPVTPTLAALRSKVVVLEAFQMLCEGCVTHSLPQARRVYETFSTENVVVIGLLCAFENHSAQTAAALDEFLREHRLLFPVAVDAPGDKSSLPQTMDSYQMQGTPTTVLIDPQGRRRAQHFGPISDLRLGAEIATLMSERDQSGH